MFNNKKILAIIPARGGSKGLPCKNIKPLHGKPLIGWTIEQAIASKFIDRIFVSTEDKKIADVSRNFGISIPFLRPSELAQDESPVSDAIIHCLIFFEKLDEFFDYLLLLEPTSPLRKKEDIDSAIEKLITNQNADSLVSVGEVHTEHPMIIKKINDKNFVIPYVDNMPKIYQRQQADKAYFPYGVIYISKTSSYKKNKTFYTEKTIPFYIERWQNYEIDDNIDFICIENILKLKSEEIA
ncbi:MAG: acylneuraminate cytidylyltransferase family protein [Bacteroidales bacterium]|jgi:CMP-N-acetylneuraminic acid synthetase